MASSSSSSSEPTSSGASQTSTAFAADGEAGVSSAGGDDPAVDLVDRIRRMERSSAIDIVRAALAAAATKSAPPASVVANADAAAENADAATAAAADTAAADTAAARIDGPHTIQRHHQSLNGIELPPFYTDDDDVAPEQDPAQLEGVNNITGEGESVLHFYILRKPHRALDLAARGSPRLINLTYTGKHYYGETALHLAAMGCAHGGSGHGRRGGETLLAADYDVTNLLLLGVLLFRDAGEDKLVNKLAEGIEFRYDVKFRGSLYMGQTVLQFAACSGNLPAVKVIVESVGWVKMEAPFKETPSYWTQLKEEIDLQVDQLTDWGLEPEKYDRKSSSNSDGNRGSHSDANGSTHADVNSSPHTDVSSSSQTNENNGSHADGNSSSHTEGENSGSHADGTSSSQTGVFLPAGPSTESPIQTSAELTCANVPPSFPNATADSATRLMDGNYSAVAKRRSDVISHPLMQAILQIKWHLYGRRKFLKSLIYTTVTIVLFTIALALQPANPYQRFKYTDANYVARIVMELFAAVVLLSNTFFIIRKLLRAGSFIRDHIAENQDWLEGNVRADNVLLGSAAIFGWLGLLYFSKAFPELGPLYIAIRRAVFRDLRSWTVLFAMVLFGFASAFFLQKNGYHDFASGDGVDGGALNLGNQTESAGGSVNATDFLPSYWDSWPASVLATFRTLFQQTDYERFSNASVVPFAKFLDVIFTLFTLVLVLNILIAKLSQSFTTIASDSQKIWRVQFANLIAEIDLLLDKNERELFSNNIGHRDHTEVNKKFITVIERNELSDSVATNQELLKVIVAFEYGDERHLWTKPASNKGRCQAAPAAVVDAASRISRSGASATGVATPATSLSAQTAAASPPGSTGHGSEEIALPIEIDLSRGLWYEWHYSLFTPSQASILYERGRQQTGSHHETAESMKAWLKRGVSSVFMALIGGHEKMQRPANQDLESGERKTDKGAVNLWKTHYLRVEATSRNRDSSGRNVTNGVKFNSTSDDCFVLD
ncbi:hypothetical protein DFJ73DRAFT_792766 [Zopfochytrium polystomum]|nr:hypothetical protein DFJ73DRAFT_792766 [Zopfochytrium polystomum]